VPGHATRGTKHPVECVLAPSLPSHPSHDRVTPRSARKTRRDEDLPRRLSGLFERVRARWSMLKVVDIVVDVRKC